MYQGYVNSPYTILSAGITDVATSIAVLDLAVFPGAPNIAVMGSGSDAETVLYTVKSAATGAGTLTVTREWNKTGTYGSKKAWLAGTVISRRFTEYDHSTFKANIEDAAARITVLEGLDALVYKGVIACAGSPNYPAGNAGDVYKVSSAGKIGGASGKVVEIGDMILCNTDATTTGDEAAKGTYWDVIQTNIDGAVTGPATATDLAIAIYNSTTGKIIKNSLATIDSSGSINIPTGQTYKINNTALAVANITGAAPIASPTFTGTATIPAIDTGVAAAGVTLTGTTLAADGTDAAIDINITPKGTGEVNLPKVDIDAGTIDGTDITVGSGKTLNVSAGTLTLATNQGNVTSGLNLSLRERLPINYGDIGSKTKPTTVDRGVFSCLSFPIYNSNDEEIFFNWSVNRRWDGASDFIIGCMAIIDTANTNKKFRLQLSWEHYAVDAIVPNTSNDVNFDKTTGTDSQYQSYPVTWTVDWNIDGAGNEVKVSELLSGRIRRIAADDNEITGEVMLHGFYVQMARNKIGVAP